MSGSGGSQSPRAAGQSESPSTSEGRYPLLKIISNFKYPLDMQVSGMTAGWLVPWKDLAEIKGLSLHTNHDLRQYGCELGLGFHTRTKRNRHAAPGGRLETKKTASARKSLGEGRCRCVPQTG